MIVIKLYTIIIHGVILLLLTFSVPSFARCTSTGVSQTEDGRTALIPFGKVNIYDTYFYPAGSLLASVVVPPTNYTYGGATASSVLWQCDASDLSDIYFLVATNGDDRVGGYYELGQTDGVSDVYATYFAYVGLKQTMSGVVLTRNWKKVPVSTYATSGSKIQIRLQDIPPLQAELYRISQLPGTSARSYYCGNNNNDGSGIIYGNTAGKLYSCTQPNSYIQLVGPGLTHDEEGQDSSTNFKFWSVDNGFGYGMRNVNRLYNTPTCVARSVTPLVLLPTITISELDAGLASSAQFNVSVECSNSVTSGTANSQTALGFQVSAGSYNAAKTLNLVNSSNGVSMLLSDNYTSSEMAKGVGITISYSNSPQTALTLIGQQGTDPLNSAYMGNNAGWYPVLDNAVQAGSTHSGYTNYNYNFTANLKKINGQTVTAGKVRATATVLVKIQ
ncbi:fimbrial protein [Proteus mirabilis]|uniref:fimbrial protein n=1 Tax=Morganellaceae TaxID=1903414 RepID=UPI001FABC058|nr:fimbrial protein [Proteus mirabilis]MCI9740279.1 fimbrial protein [Proteus mirabilis]MCI9754211.1 fimbrial protein [Proteus mirabilis]MCI9764888.1 fimbrial protein [Proteus mirabilis]MCI9783068.1 fimbrial protein [Proteus mirabilis]MDX4950817.1 fimbrial protein [Proteus mirabilis]